ncbi:Ldh family oxidoreductase [Candidatus Latescibacterota bacterium]
MNVPPEEYILVREERQLDFLEKCFAAAGLTEADAVTIGRLLTNSEVRGVRSHGIGWAPGYCSGLKDGRLNPRPDLRVVHETPTAVILDGDGGLGYVPMVRVTELAIAKARQVGMGMGLVRHIGHYGAAGHYTRMCADAGCIGYSVQGFRNDGNRKAQDLKPSVAFTGAPPMSFSLPAKEEYNMVLDMVAHAVSGYRGEGYEDLPGRIPAAFFKSMGLVAVANLMGGGLTGFTSPEGDAIAERWPKAVAGGMVLAIDVESVVPAEAFGAEVDRYIRDVQESFAPMPGYDEVLLPGGVEARVSELHRQDGIRYGDREQQAARKLHELLGVPLPWDE